MGRIYEVCEVCQKQFEESGFDGICSITCVLVERDRIGLGKCSLETCPHCGKAYLKADGRGHLCAL